MRLQEKLEMEAKLANAREEFEQRIEKEKQEMAERMNQAAFLCNWRRSEVNKRGRPSKWPPECLPSKFADFECAFSL